MTTAPVPDALRPLAPILDERLGAIFVAIQHLIAHHFLRNPFLQPVILPLCKRLNRARHCLARLAARIQQGRKLPPSRAGNSRKSKDPGPPPAPRPRDPIPRAPAWLLNALGWHVAVYRTRLEALLAEPGMMDLVAATPSLGRMLRPLCHMLALPAPCPPAGRKRKRSEPPRAPRPAAARPPAMFNWRPNSTLNPLSRPRPARLALKSS